MSRSRNDSDELPPLDDFIDSDTDGPLNGLDDGSDDFDANALLSQPIFGDSDGELEIDKGSDEFGSLGSLPQSSDDQADMTQSEFREDNQGFNAYDQGSATGMGHHSNDSPSGMNHHRGNFQHNHDASSMGSPSRKSTPSSSPMDQPSVDFQVQDVQRKIQQVQRQIEQVQLGGASSVSSHNNEYSSPQPRQQGNVQDSIDIQALMNQAGMNRSPPGRSISMPIRRNPTQGGPMNQPAFMMQQPMDQLGEQQAMMGNSQGSSASRFNNSTQQSGMNMGHLQQQQQQQQAMMGTSQGSSGSRGSNRSNPSVASGSVNMNQLQTMMNNNSIDGSLQSPRGSNSLGMMQQSLRDRQQGQLSSPDGSHGSNRSLSRSMRGMNKVQGNMMPSIPQAPDMGRGYNLDGSTGAMMGNNMQMMNNMQGMNQSYSMNPSETNMGGNMQMINNMNSMNNAQGFHQSFGGDSDTMNSMQGFNNLNSMPVQSMTNEVQGMGMNQNMMMMMMQQGNFGVDDGVSQRQNSLPGNMPTSMGMMPGQTPDMMSPGSDMDLAQMQQMFQAQGLIPGSAGQQIPHGQAQSGGLSMERLVEKMQRSAMSRNLVKQLSGRSVSRNNSGRSLNRSQSGRGVTRTNSKSGRSLSRANSGRMVQRTSSGRQLEGGELPVRRLAQDSKHRIKDAAIPGGVHRGVVRHKSQSAAMGGNNSKTVNIDGKTVGMF